MKTLLNETFFDRLLEYDHRGAKPEEVKPYALVNKLQKKVEKYEQEQVDAYNICYARLLRWLNFTLRLRKLNIEIRRAKIEKKKQERD